MMKTGKSPSSPTQLLRLPNRSPSAGAAKPRLSPCDWLSPQLSINNWPIREVVGAGSEESWLLPIENRRESLILLPEEVISGLTFERPFQSFSPSAGAGGEMRAGHRNGWNKPGPRKSDRMSSFGKAVLHLKGNQGTILR